MRKILFCILFILSVYANAQETITISGQVTDFEGSPIDSSIVRLLYPNFTDAYVTYTDKNGNYRLENVEKGKYMAMYALRPKEYPRANAVAEKDMRLEFWAWNVIADKDLTINPRYHKLELYGTTVFKTFGGYNSLFVYFRPMSLTKYISYSKDVYLDKKKAEKVADISIKPEHLKVKVYADGELLKINSVQPVDEFEGEGNSSITGYIVQADMPKSKPDKPYITIRVVAENTEFNETGENIYFYELPQLVKAPLK